MPTISLLLFEATRAIYNGTPEFPGKWRLAGVIRDLGKRSGLSGRRKITTREGFVLELDTADFLQREMFLFRSWEPEISEKLQSLLRPGDIFVDIGANVGYHTMHAAKLVGAGGRVIAFEPQPDIRKQLVTNSGLNAFENVEILPVALTDKAGQAVFHTDSAGNSGAGSLRASPTSGATIKVETDRLDDVLTKLDVTSVAAVKIDAEGAEPLVLKGMSVLLDSPNAPVILCEISEWSLEQMGYEPDAIARCLAGHGYSEPEILSVVRTSKYSSTKTYRQYDAMFHKSASSSRN